MSADLVWGLWLGAAALTLVILELWGLRRPGGTLTERLRSWLGLDPPRWWRTVGIAAFLGALLVFGWHILTG